MSIVNSRSKFPSLFEKVRIGGLIEVSLFARLSRAGITLLFFVFTCRYFQGFVLRPGHENLVAMGAISTVADDAIKCKLTFIFHSKCNGNINDNETLIAVDFNVKDRSNLIHYYGNGI